MVLAIIGFITGVAVPALYRIARSVEISSQRETLLTEIGNLSYRAYTTGEAFILGAPRTAASDLPQYPFTVPPAWALEIPEPIRYSFNGICSGGRVTLISPDQYREDLQLDPPLCKVTGGARSK